MDDCNIQEERLDEANDTHLEVYDSAVDKSTSTDDEDCHDHENEVHEEEDVQQNKIVHICQNLKKWKQVNFEIVKERIVTATLTNLPPAITLLNS